MGKWDWLIGIGAIGALAVGYLYFSKGKGFDFGGSFDLDLEDITGGLGRGIAGIEAGIGGYEDPYKYYSSDPEAFDPTSARYREIIAKHKRAGQKKVQQKYLEAYFADEYLR